MCACIYVGHCILTQRHNKLERVRENGGIQGVHRGFLFISIDLYLIPGSSATISEEKALRWAVIAYSTSAHFKQHCLISTLLKCNHLNNGTNMLLMFHSPALVPLPFLFPSLPSSLPLSPHGSGLNDNQKKFFII